MPRSARFSDNPPLKEARVDPDQGWFFARIAEHVTEQRKARGALPG
jgi:hypothetical protein